MSHGAMATGEQASSIVRFMERMAERDEALMSRTTRVSGLLPTVPPEVDRARIIEMRKAGKSIKEIAGTCGCRDSMVSRVLLAGGMRTYKQRRGGFSSAERAKIIGMRRRGAKLDAIAAAVSASASMVRTYLHSREVRRG